MKVFISWSGRRSLAVAEALHTWLPETVQSVKPWMSRRDISAGAKWTPEINEQLSQTTFGIVCLTPENQHAPWVMFEAGALAKTLDNTYVVPYLVDMDESEIEGPLSQFQAVGSSREGTSDLVQSINKALGKNALPAETLEKVFARAWPELGDKIKNLPDADAPVQKRRQSDEILREVLELVRDISRRASQFPTRRDLMPTTPYPATPYPGLAYPGVTRQRDWIARLSRETGYPEERVQELADEALLDEALEQAEAQREADIEAHLEQAEAHQEAQIEAHLERQGEAQREADAEAYLERQAEAQREAEMRANDEDEYHG